MNKKAGMELSINAIVILIIAMVVLGIGILFIRGMFAKAQITTAKALTSQETTNPASADRPLVADREISVSTVNPTATMSISVFNAATSTANDLSINLTSCISTTGANVISNISFAPVTAATVQPSQFSSFATVIGMKKVNNAYPFSAGDAIACTLKTTSMTNGNLNLTTSIIMKVEAT